jgi:hypothetical protein
MGVTKFGIFMVLAGISACTEHNPSVCEGDSDCTDPARPFCDLDGEYAESNFKPNACSATPANCPVERCGCTAGATLSCSAGTATVCGSDGRSSTEVACALGCTTEGDRCLAFEPSNGLGGALADAASEMDVTLPSNVRIDTDLGVITTTAGDSIAVKTTVIAQAGGHPSIRVFEGSSFVINNAVVSGANSLAFVAPGPISIQGTLDLGGNADVAGPGAQENPAVCVGVTGDQFVCGGGLLVESDGGGGGGNATAGATGGAVNSSQAGGALIPTFVPLVGGCRGGDVKVRNQSTILTRGGAGGGALQLVSLTRVEIKGLIDLGGGGGTATVTEGGGGGSGGLLIVEAPVLAVQGPGGVVANGGSGGGCNTRGTDGSLTTARATTPACTDAGAGGAIGMLPTNAYSCNNSGGVTCVCGSHFAGGGGAVGRLHVVTADGAIVSSSNPIVSALVTGDTLVVH